MKTLFLICALALPPMTKTKQFEELEAFIHKYFPDHDIILVNKDERLMNNYTLHTPMVFEGLRVYLRRSA